MNTFFQKMRERFRGTKLGAGGIILVLFVVYFLYQSASVMKSQSVGMPSYKESRDARNGGMSGKVTVSSRGMMELDGVAQDMYIEPPVFGGAPSATPELPKIDRKIIKNGSLDLLVKNAEVSIKGIETVAGKYKGFVDGSNVYEISEGVKGGSITIRIPGTFFAEAIQEIKTFAVKVRHENTNSQDVTAQFVDLEARLKNLKAEEEQYLEIMKRAVKIEDVLNVSQRLYQTRGQIEQTQGQMNYLSRQVEMSTITVSLTAEAEVEVFGIIWRPLTVLKQAVREGISDLAGFTDWLIVSLFKLPVIIARFAVFALVIVVVWKVIRWINRRFVAVPKSN